MLILLASSVASSFNYILGICGHPSSLTQSNVPKTLVVVCGIISNASTFPSSHSFCASFGVLVLVDYQVFSLGEPFVSLAIIYATITFISSSTRSST
jgi:hypothetical protein